MTGTLTVNCVQTDKTRKLIINLLIKLMVIDFSFYNYLGMECA